MVPQPPALHAPVLPHRMPLPATHSQGVTSSAAVGSQSAATAAEGRISGALPPDLDRQHSSVSSNKSGKLQEGNSSSKGSSENKSRGEWVSHEEIRHGKNCWDRMLQQERLSDTRLLTFYTRQTQWKLAFCFTIVFIVLGIFLLYMASGVEEITVPYTKVDTYKRFTVGTALEAPAFMWIVLPAVSFNHKSYVASKDDDLFSTALFPKICEEDADDVDDFMLRRGAVDPYFAQLVMESRGFKPCGLLSLSMFTDLFELYSCGTSFNHTIIAPEPDTAACIGSASRHIILNQANLSLDTDDAFFDKRLVSDAGGGNFMMVHNNYSTDVKDLERSWIRNGPMLEHYKAWSRAPVSPHVRNLWAVVDDGLPAGDYALKILENSVIWEQWGVPEKTVMFANKHMLGSKNGCTVLGIFCLIAAVVELAFFCTLLVLPKYIPPTVVSLTSQQEDKDKTSASSDNASASSAAAAASAA